MINIIISGQTMAGKITTINAIQSKQSRLVTIEDVHEFCISSVCSQKAATSLPAWALLVLKYKGGK